MLGPGTFRNGLCEVTSPQLAFRRTTLFLVSLECIFSGRCFGISQPSSRPEHEGKRSIAGVLCYVQEFILGEPETFLDSYKGYVFLAGRTTHPFPRSLTSVPASGCF